MADIIRKEDVGVPTLGAWDPFRVMREMMRWDPFRDIEGGWGAESRTAFAPRFDVKETNEGYVLNADLPGVRESDLNIALTGNRLTVSGKREAEERRENETYFALERNYGAFTRSFTLPEGVDADKVHAELREGVLTLMLPKRPEVKSKKISIKTSK